MVPMPAVSAASHRAASPVATSVLLSPRVSSPRAVSPRVASPAASPRHLEAGVFSPTRAKPARSSSPAASLSSLSTCSSMGSPNGSARPCLSPRGSPLARHREVRQAGPALFYHSQGELTARPRMTQSESFSAYRHATGALQPPPKQPPRASNCVLSTVGPGDVLLVQGSGQLARIGANGGFMGHVMIAVGVPTCVQRMSLESHKIAEVWPEGAEELWRVPVVESTRSRPGLHRCHAVMHINSSNELVLVGEETDIDVAICPHEDLEIWRCPDELRRSFRVDIMQSVLSHMRANMADWSYTTAARAVLQSASITQESEGLREELEASWQAAPICTSVAIAFWQRYLKGLAAATGASDIELILRWMPIKADRGLPGELLTTMKQTGWTKLALPQRHAGSKKSARLSQSSLAWLASQGKQPSFVSV